MTLLLLGNRDDLIWLAGLLEGEGTFDLHRGRYPRIRLAMTDRDVVGRAATLMDASIRMTIRTDGQKALYHSEISGERAAAIMEALLPYMGARRSSRIAEILGGYYAVKGVNTPALPGPRLTRPPGFCEPFTEVVRPAQ